MLRNPTVDAEHHRLRLARQISPTQRPRCARCARWTCTLLQPCRPPVCLSNDTRGREAVKPILTTGISSNSGTALVSAVVGTVGVLAFPLRDVSSRLAEQSELGVELTGDDTLVLSVEIAKHVKSFCQRQCVNRLVIIKLCADL